MNYTHRRADLDRLFDSAPSEYRIARYQRKEKNTERAAGPGLPAVFKDPTADLLIQSSDGVLFRVHKALLTTGSTFFKEMLLHPQPSRNGYAEESIVWQETAATITAVLYQLYPIVKPDETTVEELIMVAMAADKWGMDGVLDRAQTALLKPAVFELRPLAIYTLARRLNLPLLQCLAGQRLVELYDPLDSALRDDLDNLRTRELAFLCDLRRERVKYCLEQVRACLPSQCSCLADNESACAVVYGSWKEPLERELAQRPGSTTVPYPLPGMFDSTLCTFKCGNGQTRHSSWVEDGLQRLRGKLEDRSQFT